MEEFEKRLHACKSQSGPKGASTKANIEYWSNRASKNSDGHKHRAKGTDTESIREKDADVPDQMKPPPGKMPEKIAERDPDRVIKNAKSDPNHYGSDYYKSIRRKA